MHRLLLLLVPILGTVVAAVAQQPACYTYRGVQTCPAPIVTEKQHYYVHDSYPPQKIITNDIVVAPLVVTVPVDSQAVRVDGYNSPFYYTIGNAYREKAYIRSVIREEIQAAYAGNPPQATAQPPNAYPPQQRQAVNLGGPQQLQQEQDAVDDLTPPDLQQKVMAAYQGRGNCLGCHAGAAAQGPPGRPFRLVNDQGQLLRKSSDKRWKTYAMASVGAMPPSAANDAAKAMEAVHLPVLLQYASIKDR